jgi:ABC-type thiamine transport system ATPase subunit
MASSPLLLPTKETSDDEEDAKNDSSLIILDDGRIVWRRSLNETAQKEDSQNQLNDVLKQMGLQVPRHHSSGF